MQILWTFPGVVTNGRLGAINCPPGLLRAPSGNEDELHLIHYESDELCCWKPSRALLSSCCTKYTYIMNENTSYKGHFGSSDHCYSHWLGLDLPGAVLELSQLLFLVPEAAASAKRDATPLRLISWLSFQLDAEVEGLIEAAMLHLSTGWPAPLAAGAPAS